jgi:hypothetical protein
MIAISYVSMFIPIRCLHVHSNSLSPCAFQFAVSLYCFRPLARSPLE